MSSRSPLIEPEPERNIYFCCTISASIRSWQEHRNKRNISRTPTLGSFIEKEAGRLTKLGAFIPADRTLCSTSSWFTSRSVCAIAACLVSVTAFRRPGRDRFELQTARLRQHAVG